MVTPSPGKKMFARETKSDIVLLITLYTLLIIVSLTVLYPIIFVISSSFSSPNAINSGKVVLLPVEFSTLGYERIIQYKPLWMGFMNSTIYALGSGLVSTTMTLLAGYPLSRKNCVGRNALADGLTLVLVATATGWMTGSTFVVDASADIAEANVVGTESADFFYSVETGFGNDGSGGQRAGQMTVAS